MVDDDADELCELYVGDQVTVLLDAWEHDRETVVCVPGVGEESAGVEKLGPSYNQIYILKLSYTSACCLT